MKTSKFESNLAISNSGCSIKAIIQLIVTFVSQVALILCNICSEDKHIF